MATGRQLPTMHGSALRFSAFLGAALLTVCFAAPAVAQNPAMGGDRYRRIVPSCPAGTALIDGRCVTPRARQLCPPGTAGNYPNCRPVVRSACPNGTIGVYPNCRPTLNLPPPLNEQQRVPRIQPSVPEVRNPYSRR